MAQNIVIVINGIAYDYNDAYYENRRETISAAMSKYMRQNEGKEITSVSVFDQQS